jgi:hypothetical protein
LPTEVSEYILGPQALKRSSATMSMSIFVFMVNGFEDKYPFLPVKIKM